MVEVLGRGELPRPSRTAGALKVRSVSVATSGSGFSRRSGSDEGLQEEELAEQVPSATSVVEERAHHQVAVHLQEGRAGVPGQGPQGPA